MILLLKALSVLSLIVSPVGLTLRSIQAEGIVLKTCCCLEYVSYFKKLSKKFQVSCHRIASNVKLFWKHVLDGST